MVAWGLSGFHTWSSIQGCLCTARALLSWHVHFWVLYLDLPRVKCCYLRVHFLRRVWEPVFSDSLRVSLQLFARRLLENVTLAVTLALP